MTAGTEPPDTDAMRLDDPRLDELLLAELRKRGINTAEALRREYRETVARQFAPNLLIHRIEAALATRPRLSSLLVEQWRFAAVTFGIDSGPSRGALHDLVREAWGPTHRVEFIDAGHHSSVLVYDDDGLRYGVKRLPFSDVLIAALEAAPQ